MPRFRRSSRRSLHYFGLFELIRSAGTQNGAAGVDAVGHAAVGHLDDVVFHHAHITVAHAVDFVALAQRITHGGSDAGVHAGRVAAAGEDREFLALFGCVLSHINLRGRMSPFNPRFVTRVRARILLYYIYRENKCKAKTPFRVGKSAPVRLKTAAAPSEPPPLPRTKPGRALPRTGKQAEYSACFPHSVPLFPPYFPRS